MDVFRKYHVILKFSIHKKLPINKSKQKLKEKPFKNKLFMSHINFLWTELNWLFSNINFETLTIPIFCSDNKNYDQKFFF